MTPPPAPLVDAVSREVQGERVLWAGIPDRWAYASKYGKTSLLTIPFAAFAAFTTFQFSEIGTKDDSGLVFFPWGAVIVVFGFPILIAPLWAAFRAGRVYYVVTDRRAIIFEKHTDVRIQSFPLALVSGYDCVPSSGAGGSIIFHRVRERFGRGTRLKEVGFIGLPELTGAEQALQRLVASNVM